MSAPEPGSLAPAFELPAEDGTPLSSTDLTGGPYVLWFYPKASTPG